MSINRAALEKAIAMLEQAGPAITARQIMAAAANIDRAIAPGTYALLKQTPTGMQRDESTGKQYQDYTVTAEDIAAYIAALKTL